MSRLAVAVILALFVVYTVEAASCTKKEIQKCLDDRVLHYEDLCRVDEDKTPNYIKDIKCVQKVLSACKERRTTTVAHARYTLNRLKICQAAHRCYHGSNVLSWLQSCDEEYTLNSRNKSADICQMEKTYVDCEVSSSRNCPIIYSMLWPRWKKVKSELDRSCLGIFKLPLECKKKAVDACIENRNLHYLKLCKADDENLRYDFEAAITCVENVTDSACPGYAEDVTSRLRVCHAAYPCVHGEDVLGRLQTCDRSFSKKAGGTCKLVQDEVDCQSASAGECPAVYYELWEQWNSTQSALCKDLDLPAGGNIPAASLVSSLLNFLLVIVLTTRTL